MWIHEIASNSTNPHGSNYLNVLQLKIGQSMFYPLILFSDENCFRLNVQAHYDVPNPIWRDYSVYQGINVSDLLRTSIKKTNVKWHEEIKLSNVINWITLWNINVVQRRKKSSIQNDRIESIPEEKLKKCNALTLLHFFLLFHRSSLILVNQKKHSNVREEKSMCVKQKESPKCLHHRSSSQTVWCQTVLFFWAEFKSSVFLFSICAFKTNITLNVCFIVFTLKQGVLKVCLSQ